MIEVKLKKLDESAVIPSYSKPLDAGMDLTATSYRYDSVTDCHIYGTGIAIELPENYVGLIYPRSSNYKTDCYMTNHVGIIDAGYRGEIMVIFKHRTDFDNNIPQLFKPYEIGNRIAQLIVMPYPTVIIKEVDELSTTERGTGGHGSTGK